MTLHYQWARPVASNATIAAYLDDDFNPFNGNERFLGQLTASGTTSRPISSPGNTPIFSTLSAQMSDA